jgi:2-phosphoglycerate kinase
VTSWPGVYWIGGAPCSGKSSIARLLGEQFGMHVYHGDDPFYDHVDAADPHTQPHLHRLRAFTWEWLFMRPVPEQVADEIAIYREEFALILDDVRGLRGAEPLLMEGAALMPALIAPLLPSSTHAIFLIPTSAFQRATYAQRPWRQELLAQCADPQQAWENWMERDEQFGEVVAAQARAASLPVLIVDGQRTLQENALAVATHFGLP